METSRRMVTAANAAFGWAGRLMFPPMCLACREIVGRPGTLCGGCWAAMRFLEKPWCPVMGTPFSHDMGDGFLSAEAIANPPPYGRARAAVAYAGAARRMVSDLKFRDRGELAPWMARWMLRAGGELVADADLIVPVPLYRGRYLRRRYNQSAELARTLARLAGLPFEPDAVRRIRGTRPQVGLKASERARNVRGAFRVADERDILVRGRRVLLVDDVFTTGATVAAVTRALKRAGVGGVDVLTFARVLPGLDGDFRETEQGPI